MLDPTSRGPTIDRSVETPQPSRPRWILLLPEVSDKTSPHSPRESAARTLQPSGNMLMSHMARLAPGQLARGGDSEACDMFLRPAAGRVER